MNILYLEHYAGSPEMGMEFRPYYLSREWVKAGHSVHIVAGDYSHLRRKNPGRLFFAAHLLSFIRDAPRPVTGSQSRSPLVRIVSAYQSKLSLGVRSPVV